MPQLSVSLLPQLLSGRTLVGQAVAVIDVFRASTTICAALSAGARCIYPVKDLNEAQRTCEADSDALLGGERRRNETARLRFGELAARIRPRGSGIGPSS